MQILRYNVPISFAFDDKNHLSVQSEIVDFKLWFKLSFIVICSSFNILALLRYMKQMMSYYKNLSLIV